MQGGQPPSPGAGPGPGGVSGNGSGGRCATCQRSEGVELERCSRCEAVRYCSDYCRVLDEAAHRAGCPGRRPVRASTRPARKLSVELPPLAIASPPSSAPCSPCGSVMSMASTSSASSSSCSSPSHTDARRMSPPLLFKAGDTRGGGLGVGPGVEAAATHCRWSHGVACPCVRAQWFGYHLPVLETLSGSECVRRMRALGVPLRVGLAQSLVSLKVLKYQGGSEKDRRFRSRWGLSSARYLVQMDGSFVDADQPKPPCDACRCNAAHKREAHRALWQHRNMAKGLGSADVLIELSLSTRRLAVRLPSRKAEPQMRLCLILEVVVRLAGGPSYRLELCSMHAADPDPLVESSAEAWTGATPHVGTGPGGSDNPFDMGWSGPDVWSLFFAGLDLSLRYLQVPVGYLADLQTWWNDSAVFRDKRFALAYGSLWMAYNSEQLGSNAFVCQASARHAHRPRDVTDVGAWLVMT